MATNKVPRITFSRNARSDTNVTSIGFVINTNIGVQNKTQEQLTELRDTLDDLIVSGLLQDGAAMAKVFGEAPLVKSIAVDRLNWEVGDIQHRLHANLVVTIHHHVGKYSVPKVKDRLQSWLNAQDSPSNGWYVHFIINDRRAENYGNKDIRVPKNNQIEEQDMLSDELQRLAI